ncbi:MAG: nitrilase-related carbon-nitrogen hydrolase, partial [Bdellovibrionales bacterium]
MKITVTQIQSSEDLEENKQLILELLDSFGSNSDVVCFPENSTFIRVSNDTKLYGALEIQDPFFEAVAEKASALNCAVNIGGVPLKEGEDLSNATLWIAPGETPRVVYRKIHMFDVNVGGFKVCESASFKAGNELRVLNYKGWKFGFTICYDLRFSNIFNAYAEAGVDVVFVPAAFLVKTGEAHWQVLLRARAIESQIYIVASAQAGTHYDKSGDKSRKSYGHSMVVAPWGEVIF